MSAPAPFVFDHEYTSSDASQLMTYTVLGETTADGFIENQTIEVHVTPAELAGVLSVVSGWADDSLAKVKAGEQSYPDLGFGLEGDAEGLLSKMKAIDGAFRPADDSAVAPTFDDNSAGKKKKLQNYMNEDAEFTYGASEPTWLLKIPSLSITKVERVDYTADAVEAIFPLGKTTTVAKDAANASLPSQSMAIRNLFEQFVAANKITQDGQVSLSVGDSLDLNVNYMLSRVYSFKIDETTASAGATIAAAQFNIDGTNQSLPTGAPTTVSGARTVKITWRLVATA